MLAFNFINNKIQNSHDAYCMKESEISHYYRRNIFDCLNIIENIKEKDIIEAYDIEDLRLKELEEFRSKRLKNENLIYII